MIFRPVLKKVIKKPEMKKPDKIKQKKGAPKSLSAPRIEKAGDLQHFELTGEEDKSFSTESSETDDDEREGSGDGNIGRSAGIDKK
jgi:hypothetical protein